MAQKWHFQMVSFGFNSRLLQMVTTGKTIFLLSDRLVRFKFNEFKETFHCHKIITTRSSVLPMTFPWAMTDSMRNPGEIPTESTLLIPLIHRYTSFKHEFTTIKSSNTSNYSRNEIFYAGITVFSAWKESNKKWTLYCNLSLSVNFKFWHVSTQLNFLYFSKSFISHFLDVPSLTSNALNPRVLFY